jgi:HlyD family secretion protein
MTGSSVLVVLVMALSGCEQPVEESTYQQVKVERRDIVVSVEAAGVIEPALTVELKSKASGEILEIRGETGQVIEAGALLVQIDKRTPRNQVAQADAQLEAALARRSIASAQNRRAERLLRDGILNEVEFEQTQLELANARAEVVRSQVAVETARIQMDDTDLRAPITGTIIERPVEVGQVISSPTTDVGGGTLLLKMADLRTVQVRALVDETDIGQVMAGQAAQVTVTAFPGQPFVGTVLKIEPQAIADQTVTTFAVLIVLDNSNGLLRPGMNAEVRIVAAERRAVLAVPTMVLRTPRDIRTSAGLVGLEEQVVRDMLAGERNSRGRNASAAQGGQRYWVFRVEQGRPMAVWTQTGLTDLDVSEVLEGLQEGDQVLMLPSSGLIEAQLRMQQRLQRFNQLPGMGP